MKKDIILAGVGGQGILSIATVIGQGAIACGLHLKQAETHGMSQRGGDVQSFLRLSAEPISSDLIPRGECDLIMSLEPMEALRYLPWLNPTSGYIVTSTAPVVNIPNYPDIEAIKAELQGTGRVVMLDADAIARELRSPRSANMVLLGAASPLLQIVPADHLSGAIAQVFAAKGPKVVDGNLAAFDAGRAHTLAQLKI